MTLTSLESVMGIRDWFRSKEEPKQPVKSEPKVVLPELNREELLNQTLLALEGEEEMLSEEEAIQTTPEYDSGQVDVEDLLEEEMGSNYELNTVEETEVEEHLEDAAIIGDLPEEVEL